MDIRLSSRTRSELFVTSDELPSVVRATSEHAVAESYFTSLKDALKDPGPVDGSR